MWTIGLYRTKSEVKSIQPNYWRVTMEKQKTNLAQINPNSVEVKNWLNSYTGVTCPDPSSELAIAQVRVLSDARPIYMVIEAKDLGDYIERGHISSHFYIIENDDSSIQILKNSPDDKWVFMIDTDDESEFDGGKQVWIATKEFWDEHEHFDSRDFFWILADSMPDPGENLMEACFGVYGTEESIRAEMVNRGFIEVNM